MLRFHGRSESRFGISTAMKSEKEIRRLRNSRFGDDRVGSQIQTKKNMQFLSVPVRFLSDRHLFFNRSFEQTTDAVTRESHLGNKTKQLVQGITHCHVEQQVELDSILINAVGGRVQTQSKFHKESMLEPIDFNNLQYMACQSCSLICWCALRSLTNVSKWWNQRNVNRIINTFAENVLEQIHRAMLVDKVKLWEPSGKPSDAILMPSLLYPPKRVILKISSRFFALTGILPLYNPLYVIIVSLSISYHALFTTEILQL